MDGSPLPERYVDVELIGEGGFGRVYFARDQLLARDVAAKITHERRSDSQDIENFVLEAQRAANLHHPNIVAVHDLGFHEDFLFLTMEFAPGGTLDDLLSTEGAQPPQLTAHMVSQAGEGLGYAHDQGLVHRDVKPSNLLLDVHGVVKVGDFGLVREIDRSTTHIAGTPAYMAPEQMSDGKHPTPAADVFALAITAYELLTGQPHGGFGTLAADDPPTPVAELRPEISPAVDEVLARALKLSRNERTDDVRGFARDLADALGGNDGSPAMPEAYPQVIRIGGGPVEPVEHRVQRTFAGVKWSGAANSRDAAKAIKIATIQDDVVEMTYGLDRDEAFEFLDALGDRSDFATAGIDFGFSVPGWYAQQEGFDGAEEYWAHLGDLARAHGKESQWPRECLGLPFWGPRIRPQPTLASRDLWFRRTEEEVRSRTGMPPQSVFRLAGQGSVGTLSARGMPYLPEFQALGWSVWPFDAPGKHNIVEIFPSAYRVLVLSNWLRTPTHEANLIRVMDEELDLDAQTLGELQADGRAVSALLAAWLLWRDPSPLPDLTDDSTCQLEGRIWLPTAGL